MPLALARMPEEDLMSDEEVKRATEKKVAQQKSGQRFTQPNAADIMTSGSWSEMHFSGSNLFAQEDDLMKNLEHVNKAQNRSRENSINKQHKEDEEMKS